MDKVFNFHSTYCTSKFTCCYVAPGSSWRVRSDRLAWSGRISGTERWKRRSGNFVTLSGKKITAEKLYLSAANVSCWWWKYL